MATKNEEGKVPSAVPIPYQTSETGVGKHSTSVEDRSTPNAGNSPNITSVEDKSTPAGGGNRQRPRPRPKQGTKLTAAHRKAAAWKQRVEQGIAGNWTKMKLDELETDGNLADAFAVGTDKDQESTAATYDNNQNLESKKDSQASTQCVPPKVTADSHFSEVDASMFNPDNKPVTSTDTSLLSMTLMSYQTELETTNPEPTRKRESDDPYYGT